MVTQRSSLRHTGVLPRALRERLDRWAAEHPAQRGDAPTLREHVHTREIGKNGENTDLQARLTRGESVEGWKVERLDGSDRPTQACEFSMSSYKAQNPEISAEPTYRKPVNRSATPERLDKALEKFPQGDSLEGELKQAAARREESAQSHRIAAPYINPTPNPKYPLAAYQNPTNNPTVALLLERYGDMRGIFTKHPLFLKMVKPEEEGGWGVGLGGLINLGKQYGLERVLRAAKEAREYVGATSRGAVFNHAVRNGLEAGK